MLITKNAILDSLTDKKPGCILLLKLPKKWDEHLVRKLSLLYSVQVIYALPVIKEGGHSGLIRKINHAVINDNLRLVLFCIDFYAGMDHQFITRITKTVKKVLVTFDDTLLHDFNAITSAACDLVLTADPISVLKYQEKLIPSCYMTLEASEKIYRNQGNIKKNDVLFFGVLGKADRKDYIDYLSSRGINVRIVGGESGYVSTETMVDEINNSKIVINFSKTDRLSQQVWDMNFALKYRLQFKGRIIESALCGTPCISEYSPSIPLLFRDGEVPMFSNPSDCYKLVDRLLKDEDERQIISSKQYSTVLHNYSDCAQVEIIRQAIGELDKKVNSNSREIDIPFWYRKMVLRKRLRDVSAKPKLLYKEFYDYLREETKGKPYVKTCLVGDTLLWFLYWVVKEKVLRLR